MKSTLLTLILSVTLIVHGQDSLLKNSWIKLTTQFNNRIQVAGELVNATLALKSVDTTAINDLKELSFSLTRRLSKTVIPTQPAIDSIKIENLLFIGALSKVLMLLENNEYLQLRNDLKNFQTSLMSAENRIAITRKNYNESCKRVGREDLTY